MLPWFKKNTPEDLEVAPLKEEDFGDVSSVAHYFQALTGISFAAQHTILESKMKTFCKRHHSATFDEIVLRARQEPSLRQELIDYLTTNETYFYREIAQLDALLERVRAHSNKVRILCAPCATGEEPYSIAMRLIEGGIAAQRFEIIGIDINVQAIQKAQQALYRERNVHKLSAEQKQRFFHLTNGMYALDTSIKACVHFEVANIFDPDFKNLGSFDYIFSRNMLIYFDVPAKLKATMILESMRNDTSIPIFFGHADLF